MPHQFQPGRENEPSDAACFVQVSSNCSSVDQDDNPFPQPHPVATQHGVITTDLDTLHSPAGRDDGPSLSHEGSAARSAEDTIIISSDPEVSVLEDSAEESDVDKGEPTENHSPKHERGTNYRYYSSSRTQRALASADINQDPVGSKQHRRQLAAPSSKPLSTRRHGRQSQARARPPDREQTAAYDADVDVLLPQPRRILLPRTQYGRSRRIATPTTADLPLVAVTMRGDCHFIHRKEK